MFKTEYLQQRGMHFQKVLNDQNMGEEVLGEDNDNEDEE